MSMARQLWFLQSAQVKPAQSLLPLLAGVLMLVSTFLPWLVDPLGITYNAWSIALDIGWQFHIAILNYGILCILSAGYAFLVAFAHWRPFPGSSTLVQQRTLAGLLCFVPPLLLAMQYLYMDVLDANTLSNHLIQFLLIQRHFGYGLAPMRVFINPLLLDSSTLWDRAQVFINQVGVGVVLPWASAWMLIDRKRLLLWLPPLRLSDAKRRSDSFVGSLDIKLARVREQSQVEQVPRLQQVRLLLIGLFFLLLLGRSALALFCEAEAKSQLASGNYITALNWLDRAHFLNPALEEVAYYHIERGQALYYTLQGQESDDSRLYLASIYSSQKDYLDAYAQLIAVWHPRSAEPWIIDAMSLTLERLTEAAKPLYGLRLHRMQENTIAANWLRLLQQVDATNVYGSYVSGRINYEQHDYSASIGAMNSVLHSSANNDVASSAYTYIALSEGELGNAQLSRLLLLKAVALDPNFRNDTAREELSGLR